MANPRDFLPAKYKKTDQSDVIAVPEVEPKSADEKDLIHPAAPSIPEDNSSQTNDSLWSGLASDADSVTKPMSTSQTTLTQGDASQSLSTGGSIELPGQDGHTNNSDTDDASQENPSVKQFSKPKNNNKLTGILVILFLVVGTVAGFFLMQQNQDGRQQASTSSAPPHASTPVVPVNGTCPTGYSLYEVSTTGMQVCLQPSMQGGGGEPPTSCGAGLTLVFSETNPGQSMCAPNGSLPPTPNTTPTAEIGQGEFGWCYSGSGNSQTGEGVVGGGTSACSADQWDNPDALIAGTYWWCTPGTDVCGRYVINIPTTLQAAIDYFVNNPNMAQALLNPEDPLILQANGTAILNGNPLPLELAPFLTCGSTSDGYNTLSNDLCNASSGVCAWTDEVTITVQNSENGQTTQQTQTRCYLTSNYYVENFLDADPPLTWSPYNTGCGDGVHDYPGQTTLPGSSTPVDSSYVGDCNTWHFTTCLNPGTGVNGLGCDITTTPPNEPPNEPPSEPPTTTTPPPTGTPTPTPTLPPELVCTDIEMLDASGSAMTGDDDQNLVDGDRVRFRSSASAEDPDATFEFRILPPNTYAWIDITDTSATAAPDVSAFYTIVSSGHHVVQSRLCIDGVCQVWESNDQPIDDATATFDDVPTTYWAFNAIEALYANNITAGCSDNPLEYCPDEDVTREEAAALIMRAKYGADYNFTASSSSVFTDVALDSPFRKYIEKMYADGIISGCSTNPLRFCPTDTLSREIAALQIMRAALGANYNFVAAATPIFSDVPDSNTYRKYIEKMYSEGISSGCSSNPLQFCPSRAATRAELAVMIYRAFLRAYAN